MDKLAPAITLDHNPQRTTHRQQLIDSLVSRELVVTLILANFLLLLYSINLPLYPQHYTRKMAVVVVVVVFVAVVVFVVVFSFYAEQ